MTTIPNPFCGIFINDTETATDLLYYEAIAKTVVGYIDGCGDKPISIGVHGDWGAGKSSVLKMVEAQVAEHSTRRLAPGFAQHSHHASIFLGANE